MVSGIVDTNARVIQNVTEGTECGEIKLVNETLIGRRVVHEEHFGTICYAGVLPKSKGLWLGIDWDNASRGRHNGVYLGIKYFETKSDTSGSFVRSDKVSLGTSLEEALVYRYVLCAECQIAAQKLLTSVDVVSNPTSTMQFSDGPIQHSNVSGRMEGYFSGAIETEEAEYSGQGGGSSVPFRIELFTTPARARTKASETDSADKHQRCGPQGAEIILKRLRSASLTLIPVFRALKGGEDAETAPLWPHPGGTLGTLLPNLEELELSGCLFSRWIDVAEACIQLPWLKALTVSNNRMRLHLPPDHPRPTESSANLYSIRLQFDIDTDPLEAERICAKAFPNICQLILVRLGCLDWTGLLRIIQWTPSIKSLAAPYNHLGPIPETWPDKVVTLFQQLVDLDLTQTGISDLTQLFSILGPSTTLDSLMLNQNAIVRLPVFPVAVEKTRDAPGSNDPTDAFQPTTWFPNLTTLGLRQCEFEDWECMKQLMRLARLKHLFFLDCPVLGKMNAQTGRQEVIARLPNLSILNRVEVCAEERRGAELDYLKRYGAEWATSEGTVVASSDGTNSESIKMSEDFAQKHPVFTRLCAKYGPPEAGETKFVTRSIKEGLISVTLMLEPSGDSGNTGGTPQAISANVPLADGIVRRIPGRMTISHLKMLARRLFKLPARVSFDLVAQGERHRKINVELPMDTETREVGFYNLEDGDVIYLRIR